jgi:hypothetical protein
MTLFNYEVGRSVVCALALAVLGLAGCGGDAHVIGESTDTTQQALAPNSDAAFVWSSATTGSFDADPGFSYNSTGRTNHITWLGPGQYRVDIPSSTFTSFGFNPTGNVQVTAYGGFSQRCKVASWAGSGSTLQVFVNCFTAAGGATNALFVMDYLRRNDRPPSPEEGAYLIADNPSAASYTVTNPSQWNSAGYQMSVFHTPGTGMYFVALFPHDIVQGTVQVTALGPSNAYCNVAAIGAGVSVGCVDGTTHQPVESMFALNYSTGSPDNVNSFTYAWQNTNPPMSPTANYPFSGATQKGFLFGCTGVNRYPIGATPPAPSFMHLGTGSYRVKFPWMSANNPSPSSVIVTHAGDDGLTPDPRSCKVGNWFTSGTDSFANVFCFDGNGNLADDWFMITYSSFAFTVC